MTRRAYAKTQPSGLPALNETLPYAATKMHADAQETYFLAEALIFRTEENSGVFVLPRTQTEKHMRIYLDMHAEFRNYTCRVTPPCTRVEFSARLHRNSRTKVFNIFVLFPDCPVR